MFMDQYLWIVFKDMILDMIQSKILGIIFKASIKFNIED
jgi:hypothetical protein